MSGKGVRNLRTDRWLARFLMSSRSFAWGIYGQTGVQAFLSRCMGKQPFFNGLVTGGAETGSSGTWDDKLRVLGEIARVFPILASAGAGSLSDLRVTDRLAVRVGCGFAAAFANRT